MPSVKNPNGPSKNRLAARTATARKHTTKQLARKTLEHSLSQQSKGKITKADARRGARAGLLPTSGPNRALGAKKARKLERKMGYALKRKMEAEGEVEMKDVSEETETKTKTKTNKQKGAVEGDATVEMDDISSTSRPMGSRDFVAALEPVYQQQRRPVQGEVLSRHVELPQRSAQGFANYHFGMLDSRIRQTGQASQGDALRAWTESGTINANDGN
ncbi:hypothetical protein F5B21DRAFT_509231 [Xylaria acuta]|nr:hypothetical protein F5B21DRAFT_509231 [Xylaria acuta]